MRPGETGRIGLFALLFDSCVTERIVVPLKNVELEEDLGDRGVRGLGPSELAPGVCGDVVFALIWRVEGLRSKFGIQDCLDGILDVDRGSDSGVDKLSGGAGKSDTPSANWMLKVQKKIDLLLTKPYVSTECT